MARRRNKEFNHVIFLLVSLSIILSISKRIWTNVFFSSLIFVEISLILILIYFWLENYFIKTKDIVSELDKIEKMKDTEKGTAFEIYVRDLYIKLGYKAYTTPYNDFGADVIAIKDNVIYCIQAKCNDNKYKVGNKAVQEVIGSINFYKANQGIVITNRNFTSGAIKLADKNDIILINRKQLQYLIKKTSLSTNIKLNKFIKFIKEP